MAKNTVLYTKAVEVSEEYLGPAGERFIRRQISMHLAIEPEALSKQHMRKLINWSRLAFALLTSDQRMIDDFTDDLRSLTEDS
jgi:hypothetical protein